MNIDEIGSYVKENIIESDSVAVKWDWERFINEWVIKKDTKLKVWELLNIGWVTFPIKDIFYAMPGLHYVNTKYWNYSIKEAVSWNNFEAYKYYEKTRSN